MNDLETEIYKKTLKRFKRCVKTKGKRKMIKVTDNNMDYKLLVRSGNVKKEHKKLNEEAYLKSVLGNFHGYAKKIYEKYPGNLHYELWL